MWYLAWFLAILLACACSIILGVWLENTHLPPEPPQVQ
ncbi:cytochrome bd-I oxidase subunit CydX [Plesiomonas shigelloides]|nr:cytochrome bd-I oxidase subunit CydX [Plesiomonas shigelloides]PVU65491.1 cytochrome bd-I oxidase subunit CydX [Plesiomonas shigelloides]